MTKMKERLLSAVLALTLTTSSIPVTAFAETNADPVEEPAVVEVVEVKDEDEVAVEEGTAAELTPESEPEEEVAVEVSDVVATVEPATEPDESREDVALLAAGDEDNGEETDDFDLSHATVTIDAATYTGYELEPVIHVVLNGYELAQDYDFHYSWDYFVDPGTYEVNIWGAGDYRGNTTATFTIKPCPISKATVSGLSTKTYTGKAIKPSLEVEWDGFYLERGVDYTVSYQNNVQVGTATVIIKGKGYFGGSVKKTFRIVQASISKASVAKIGTQKWTTKAIKPKPVVKYGGTTLKQGTDYTLSYKNNVKAGSTATITITGKGSFKGTKTVTFKIGPKTGAWKKSGGRWWYRYLDGSYPKSEWKRIDGSWYCFDGSGWMVTGWSSVGGTWYYFNSSGAMATGWKSIGGSWYYFDSSGAMARNRWQGDYYLGSSGAMLTNTTTPDGYRVGSNGKWIRDSGGSGSYGTVYWVPGGTVWHSTPDCSTLSRSKTILSGSIAESGKPRGCYVCTS